MPIEDIFPDVFDQGTGIKVLAKSIHGLKGYEIEEFPESEKNRNHWDKRGEDPVQYLVMHYTVSNFRRTLSTFTSNVNEGRVSAHYVLTQQDDAYKIEGGIPIQIVPEAMRAWHAGISSWNGLKNLNATSLGIENINAGFIGARQGNHSGFPLILHK